MGGGDRIQAPISNSTRRSFFLGGGGVMLLLYSVLVNHMISYLATSSIPSQSTICSTEKLVKGLPIIAHCPSMFPIALI